MGTDFQVTQISWPLKEDTLKHLWQNTCNHSILYYDNIRSNNILPEVRQMVEEKEKSDVKGVNNVNNLVKAKELKYQVQVS